MGSMEGDWMRKGFLTILLCLWGATIQAQSVQVLGDSVLVWNSWQDSSIAKQLERSLSGPIVTNAAAGATLDNPNVFAQFFGAGIAAQYETGNWDWVVVNGGVNDIVTKCGCGLCGDVLNSLSSADGRQGAMPDLINRARDEGSQVVLLGSYFSPITGGPIWDCADEIAELNARYKAIAEADVDVYFVDARALISRHKLTLYDQDLIHLSVLGSRILAEAITQTILEN